MLAYLRAKKQNNTPSSAFVASVNLLASPVALRSKETEKRIRESEMPEYLKINVGGTPFCLSSFNVLQRGEIGLMYKFFISSHETRLKMCHHYFHKTEEYYFERPATFFDPIYAYYATGVCYRPKRSCMNMFFMELSYWGLTKVFFPELKTNESSLLENVREHNEFAKLRLGRFRRQVWNLFEVPESSKLAKLVAVISIAAVLLSILCLILGSMKEFQVSQTIPDSKEIEGKEIRLEQPLPVLEYIEAGCIAFFTIEYLAKLLAAHNRRKAFTHPMNIIDLVAIIPFYVEHILDLSGLNPQHIHNFQGALLVMRILRISRVLRLLKLGRHSIGLQLVARVITTSLFQLGMVAISAGVSLIFFSTLIYFAEKDEPNTKFSSIPASFWWAIVSMTTVGYGDMFPETIVGKLIASCAISIGVLVCALPITVLVDNFVNVQQEFKEVKQTIERNDRIRSRHGLSYKGPGTYVAKSKRSR